MSLKNIYFVANWKMHGSINSSHLVKKIGNYLWQIGDVFIIDGFGPNGFAKITRFFSNQAVKFQSGYLYHYAFVMLIFLSIFLTIVLI